MPSIALRVVSIESPGAACQDAGGTITCTLGTLPVGQTVKIVVAARVRASGLEHNTATASSATKLVDPQDATSTATTKVEPILDIHEKESRTSATTGQNVIYETTVVNPTTVPIRKVTVCDDLPSGLLYVRSNPGAHARSGQPCWTILKLPAGRSKHVTAVSNVSPGTGGKRVDRATASAPGVRAGHASVVVNIIRAPQLPCGVASAAALAGSGRHMQAPVARAAC